jgi:hypothetical protein
MLRACRSDDGVARAPSQFGRLDLKQIRRPQARHRQISRTGFVEFATSRSAITQPCTRTRSPRRRTHTQLDRTSPVAQTFPTAMAPEPPAATRRTQRSHAVARPISFRCSSLCLALAPERARQPRLPSPIALTHSNKASPHRGAMLFPNDVNRLRANRSALAPKGPRSAVS